MTIDFEASDNLNLKEGDELNVANDVGRGDLVMLRRKSRGYVELVTLSERSARRNRTAIYRVELGTKKDTFVLQRLRRPDRLGNKPGFAFGIYEFDDFGDWMLQRFRDACANINEELKKYPQAMKQAHLRAHPFSPIAECRAYDVAYLAIMALGVQYSLLEDFADGSVDPVALVRDAPLQRATFMLEYHASHLPVRLEASREKPQGESSIFEQRAAIVAHVLLPVIQSGFAARQPGIKEFAADLPKPLKCMMKAHTYGGEPLCQFMVASFYFAFGWFVPDGDDRYWDPLLKTFWPPWESYLLDANDAITNESLNGEEEEV